MRTIDIKNMSREEWLQCRTLGIGGSDLAAIMEVSPWSTPADVWRDKTGRSEKQPPNIAMQIGTDIEPLVRRLYSEATCSVVIEELPMVVDDEHHIVGNLDGVVEFESEIYGLECKTAKCYSSDWNGEVPEYYQTQVQLYMALFPEFKKFDLACLFLGDYKFEIFPVLRDDESIAGIKKYCRQWWEHYVIGDKCPPAVNLGDIRKQYARSKTTTKEVNKDTEAIYGMYKMLVDDQKKLKGETERLKVKLCEAIGSAEAAVNEWGQVLYTFKSNKAGNRVFKGK